MSGKNVIQKTSGGINLIPQEDYLNSRQICTIQGEITSEKADEFIRTMLCQSLSYEGRKPVTVLINSPGGEIGAGLTLYDAIQGCQTAPNVVCFGRAYSMAALLLACGKKGARYILPHSEVMIHEPRLGSSVSGTASSLASISESLQKTRHQMNELLALHTGKSLEEVEKATRYDNYLSAEEAVAFGLADRIITYAELIRILKGESLS